MEETCIRFGQHGARVMIEEKEIPHYAIHVDPVKKEVSCWIASEAGKAFSVIWLELDVDYPTSGSLRLDGHRVKSQWRQHAKKPTVFRHVTVSESSRVPFLFSPLDITDDDSYLDTSPSHSIGEIKFVISRTIVLKKKKRRTYFESPHLQMVHERSKKAITHRVNYGTVENLRKKKSMTQATKHVETLVTFIFRYRPLEMLHANDIVPRNPEFLEPQEHALDTPPIPEMSTGREDHSKVKKEDGSGPETDYSDEDSMREKALLAELERIQAEVEKFRKARRRSKDSERPKKKLKKEENFFFTPGEIIDLT